MAISDDIYLAYWFRTLKPVFEDGVYAEMVFENKWMKRYFEDDFVFNLPRKDFSDNWSRRFLGRIFGGGFGDFSEKRLMKWQLKRGQKKASKLDSRTSSIIINEHVLKFHNVDRRTIYRDRFRSLYGGAKVTEEKFMRLK